MGYKNAALSSYWLPSPLSGGGSNCIENLLVSLGFIFTSAILVQKRWKNFLIHVFELLFDRHIP
ncbi:Hypothetical protein I595_981 [Croceitalea dokdonensis DOKDO 023]|uniref:Uncharacterized protein n=1 Tax=Croceitalea dokdonensis DOKDO 023 TaxID=1300341 RepID=A0A0P7AL39_9FLAO|nr:Hypothetical protein I595_981 [Croceitalea dokdonensis DOKDO 023]